MKIKTKGKCPECNKVYGAAQARSHLLSCVLKSKIPSKATTEGYLIRASCSARPEMYWCFATIPLDASLDLLDSFLRDMWLECCDHMSALTIEGRHYTSHETEDCSLSAHQIGQLLSTDLICEYVYDMGSSTDLEIRVLEKIDACPQDKVTLIMRNEPPVFSCESCKKAANTICSQCGNTICRSCRKRHSCVVSEEDDYMLMNLVNSPRTGVCGYEG